MKNGRRIASRQVQNESDPLLLRTILIASLAGASVFSTAPGSPAESASPDVVLITVDTLRADRLGCYGNREVPTPTADRLARDGVLFTRAIAQVPLTLPSHVAILTGTFPMWNGVEDLATQGLGPGIPTLAEIYRRHGYATAAFVSAFVLNSMWGLDRGFDIYDDSLPPQADVRSGNRNLERKAGETVNRCLHWLEAHESQPFFLWIHLYDPHAPYNAPEPFKSRFRKRPYEGEVAYADQQLGRLIAHLEAHNLYSRSLILFTSDHGEGLGEHGEQQHGLFVYNSTVHVPVILKPPASFAFSRRRVNQVVNSVDIAPTLVQFCQFPAPDSAMFQGRSLLPLLRSPAPGSARDAYSESLYPRSSFGWHSLHAIETDRYHYIEARTAELYDLNQDPRETRNVIAQFPSVAATLRETLRGVVNRYGHSEQASKSVAAADLEKLRDLRSLGYVGASPTEPLRGDPPGAADPRERIGFYNLIMRATELAEDGRHQDSDVLLMRAAGQEPEAYLPRFLLGENALAQGRFTKAREYYLKALDLNPRYELAAIGLGQTALRAGDPAQALKPFRWALELNPHDEPVKLAMATAYERLKRFQEAADLEKGVLEAHPGDAKANSDYGVTLVRMKRYPEALLVLRKAVEAGYSTAITYNFLGTAELAAGHTEEAVRAYEKAVRLDARYSAAYGNLALLYLRMGQNEKAQQYYRRVCQFDSEICRELSARFR
jgi:choline-sulfatase